MKRGGASWARSLVGSVAIVAAASTAGAQQVELVPFRTADDGVVIEVGKPAPKPAPEAISMESSVSTDTLLQDFASLAPAPTMMPAVVPEQIQRSSIPVPLWMQTGKVSLNGLVAASVAVPHLYSPAAGCSLSPYRPRGDLPAYLEQRRERYYPLISAVACETGVPVGLFDALVAQESQYNPVIVSPKGAVGLTQLMPGTAAYLGVYNSRDPLQNLRGGARYLREHLDEFKRVDLALAAYNAGPGRVRLKGQIPPFRETIGYVSAITRRWSASAFRTATIQTASTAIPRPSFRGAQLFAYTSTSVANPR